MAALPGDIVWRSWADFWGELILVRLPQSHPGVWERRQEKAEWVWRTLGLHAGARVLDLGCGDGLLDICLARLGARVTAVDRLAPVLEQARAQAGEAPVTFRCDDLRSLRCRKATFDAVLLLEVVGLMSRDDDCALIRRAARWLRDGGCLVADCPSPPGALSGTSSWEMPEGTLTLVSTYDPLTRLKHMEPTLHDRQGGTVGLQDPYDPTRPDHTGVVRYCYQEADLTGMLAAAGLGVRSVPHYASPEGCLLLIGDKPAAPPSCP